MTRIFEQAKKARVDIREIRHVDRWSVRASTSAFRHMGELLATISGLPVIPVRLHDAAARRHVHKHLAPSMVLPGLRVAAFLEIGASGARYLSGRLRQAVRSNITKAKREGSIACPIAPDELFRHIKTLSKSEPAFPYLHALAREPVSKTFRHWVAKSSGDYPLVLARVQVIGEVAVLKYFCSSVDAAASAARYLLFSKIVEDLTEEAVAVLLANMPRKAAGVVYFQERLGFRPCRVRVERGTH